MTRVKICGITNFEDAHVATEAGADLLGFIFYKPSPRYVLPERVREIVERLKAGKGASLCLQAQKSKDDQTLNAKLNLPQFVGVFVNTPLPEVKQILEFCQLDAAQLHGEESPEFVAYFNGRGYKALRPKSSKEAENLIKKYTQSSILQLCSGQVSNFQSSLRTSLQSQIPHLLLDAYHPGLYGGTGCVADWTMAANIAQQHVITLAGSLTSENVAEAIKAVKPWGVDVSSGVELEKGRKDHRKVSAFIEAVRKVEYTEVSK